MKVGKYFSLEEFLVSQNAARAGIKNIPTTEAIENIKKLCEFTLDPLREAIQVPIIVTSGYRSPQVNKLVRGAKNSQHLEGKAADIIIPGWTIEHVVMKIRFMGLPFDQLIDEFSDWTHVSLSNVNRYEVLRARVVKKKTVYTPIR